MQIPNFDATVICDGGKDRGSEGRPADVVDLFLKGDAYLLADLLFAAVLVMPDAHGPIVGAGQEDGALCRVPEGVAPDAVNGASVAVVVVRVSL